MKTKIAVIAVNPNCERRESKLRGFLSRELRLYDMQMIRFHSDDISDMIEEAKKKTDITILVFDAVEGMNIHFATAGRELYENEVLPILLITNCNPEDEYMINKAKTSLGEIWLTENSELNPDSLNFNYLFFSYDKMAIDYFPETESNGIDILIKEINHLMYRNSFN